MKTWEFRNILIDLNEIERAVLAYSSTVPDFVVLRKIADIRIKLLFAYKNYSSGKSPLINDDQSSEIISKKEHSEDPVSTPQPELKWCVEITDDLGGLKSHMYDNKKDAEEFARNMTIKMGFSDTSIYAYRVIMKYIVE